MTHTAWSGLGLVLVLSLAGCLPAGSEAPAPNTQASLTVAQTETGPRYRATILAPDPCYRVRDDAEVERLGDTMVITRVLVREPGICATVLTPLNLDGPLPPLPSGVEKVELRLQNPEGEILSVIATEP